MGSEKYNHYSGIIHVHSTYSDGTRSVQEIAAIANELDINFLFITDHNTIQARKDGLEGWYNKVLIGIGCELNDYDDLNHYLVFDVDDDICKVGESTQYVKAVRDSGGFGIIAHPDENRSHISRYPPYPWKIWELDFDGIEIWNHMSEWMEGLTHLNKFRRVLHPRNSIIMPKKETLEKWDKINLERKVVGIGGADAHGFIHKILGIIPIRVFRYKILFKTIRTHILTRRPLSMGDDYKNDLKIIYKAIKDANCFVSHHYLGNAAKFWFEADNGYQSAIMGESIKLKDKPIILNVFNPRPAKTLLIHNGIKIKSAEGQNLSFSAEAPGVYRVEAHIDNRPWILSNHIRVINN
ncbi:MAG: hypothetical protein P8X42_14085 [Calditrichaceae bacterium]|jgi:hypothetical protein